MPRMVRKQVYIEPYQEAALKAQAAASGVTEAELIRKGIDLVLSGGAAARDSRQEAWERLKVILDERAKLKVPQRKRTWKREDAYERGGKPLA